MKCGYLEGRTDFRCRYTGESNSLGYVMEVCGEDNHINCMHFMEAIKKLNKDQVIILPVVTIS